MASYPWIVPWKRHEQNLDDFPNLKRWFEAIRNRPAVMRAYEAGEPWVQKQPITEEARKVLFGQTAAVAKA
jgi:GST-like protein